ncbi:hypothetical protein PAPYR_7995 [Paratrimastix pyriformis]|uniref:C2H2-type domain-containing protein n=1 Tax=Paratrimastix pyriformis TaxID=342808 RepID=A0ABQ8UFP3_9EUKA|nr:hypothetical protein PAPYR_7995 [Paratrimastix pyriformis]
MSFVCAHCSQRFSDDLQRYQHCLLHHGSFVNRGAAEESQYFLSEMFDGLAQVQSRTEADRFLQSLRVQSQPAFEQLLRVLHQVQAMSITESPSDIEMGKTADLIVETVKRFPSVISLPQINHFLACWARSAQAEPFRQFVPFPKSPAPGSQPQHTPPPPPPPPREADLTYLLRGADGGAMGGGQGVGMFAKR